MRRVAAGRRVQLLAGATTRSMHRLKSVAASARRARRGPWHAQAVVLAAIALAAGSAWHSGRRVWHTLAREQRHDAALTPLERKHTFLTQVGLPPDVFDFYARYVGREAETWHKTERYEVENPVNS